MPQSWIAALSRYNYSVDLSSYKRAGEFPGFFTQDIVGDRASTIEFEDYFREHSRSAVEPYFEVAFWVLCGQSRRFEKSVDRIVDHVLKTGRRGSDLRGAIDRFVDSPTKENLTRLRGLLGIKSQVLTVALTFTAFVDPDRFPMMDMKAARWITGNYLAHGRNRTCSLAPFKFGYTSLRYNQFENYLNWAKWCRETAEILTGKTDMTWRARDVEMAVFTAAREGLSLDPLP